MQIKEYYKNELLHVSLENDQVRVTFLPAIGGKMIELTNKKTGRQFLLEPQNKDHSYRPAFYGATFDDYDTSGFDECFPTIEAADYPFSRNGKKISFPDHGEVWAIPWSYRREKNSLVLSVEGVNFSYTLQKMVQLDRNTLRIGYSLFNHSQIPFCFIWSAHPLLKIEPGAKLVVDPHVGQVFLNWSSDEKIGSYGDRVPWPYLAGDRKGTDFSEIQPEGIATAVKCFTDKLPQGIAGIHYNTTDEYLIFQFDTQQIPYLGLWLCYGGWPQNQPAKHLTVGLEPATGRPDSLAEAIRRGEYAQVEAGGVKKWNLLLSVWQGKPRIEINNFKF